MNTLDQPTEQNINEQVFWKLLSQVDHDLFALAITLRSNKIQPFILEMVTRAIAGIERDGGWGNVSLKIEDNVIMSIEGKHHYQINMGITKELEESRKAEQEAKDKQKVAKAVEQ